MQEPAVGGCRQQKTHVLIRWRSKDRIAPGPMQSPTTSDDRSATGKPRRPCTDRRNSSRQRPIRRSADSGVGITVLVAANLDRCGLHRVFAASSGRAPRLGRAAAFDSVPHRQRTTTRPDAGQVSGRLKHSADTAAEELLTDGMEMDACRDRLRSGSLIIRMPAYCAFGSVDS